MRSKLMLININKEKSKGKQQQKCTYINKK